MGLDITAVRHAVWVQPMEPEPKNWMGMERAYANPDFDRHDGLKDGWYRCEVASCFRAGSYSGYNWWREELCRTVLGVCPRDLWESRPEYDGEPLSELIDFSDCEGVIGPVTSAKLARDFADNWGKLMKHEDDGFRDLCRQWRLAFEAASDGGFVMFH